MRRAEGCCVLEHIAQIFLLHCNHHTRKLFNPILQLLNELSCIREYQLDCCLPGFDHNIRLLEYRLYPYIGNLYYLHVANLTISLPTSYYSLMSFFSLSSFLFFLSFFLFTFFFESFMFYPPFFFCQPKNISGTNGPLYYASLFRTVITDSVISNSRYFKLFFISHGSSIEIAGFYSITVIEFRIVFQENDEVFCLNTKTKYIKL